MDSAVLDQVSAAHARLCRSVGEFDDEQVRAPSRLPGWPRDMLLAHLRYGAEAALVAAESAEAGQTRPMYPGGEEQRDREIASGAGRPVAELAAELADACARLDAAFRALSPAAWDVPVVTRRGALPMREIPVQRWLDVEAHHVDLDIGYRPDDWPAQLVDTFLPRMIATLPALRARPDADPAIVGSWLIRRTDADGTWAVRADESGVEATPGTGPCSCELSGTGTQLLAALIGRAPIDSLALAGDQALAGNLKRAFPGP